MIKILFGIALIVAWVYVLNVLRRTKLQFWLYLIGAGGTFLLLMILVRPWLTMPLARVVASLAGVVGSLTNTFGVFYKYGVLFVNSDNGAITLMIDMECSGIIEISAFLSMLAFFRVYDVPERVLVGILGTIYTLLANALRITIICLTVYFHGMEAYYISHTFIGRIVFYILQVFLYFYVFTKPQIVRMQVGSFSYGKDEKKEEKKA